MIDLFEGVSEDQKRSMDEMLAKAASPNRAEAAIYREQVAKALELPLRPGVLAGDIFEGIFEPIELKKGAEPKFPLHYLSPGTEKEFVAYTLPNHGKIPQKRVEADYVSVPYYQIGGSIDCVSDYLEDARWDVMSDMAENLRGQFTKKINDDKAHVLLSAAADRNIIVYDGDAAAGQFTKRLVSMMKTVMMRNGGGNASSVNKFRLTDLYMSPEAIEDMRNWGLDQISDIDRAAIFRADDGTLNRVFSVNLHPVLELGEAQEYQLYYNTSLAGTLPSGDVELVLGCDLSRKRGAVMPIVKSLRVYDDPTLARENITGWYARMSLGLAALDSRQFIFGSM